MAMSLTLNTLETKLANEIEQLRRNPHGYADLLDQDRRPHYNGSVLPRLFFLLRLIQKNGGYRR